MGLLTKLETGHEAIIGSLNGGKRFISRASAMGFIPNTPVFMLQNTGKGPLLVYLRDTQVGIGRSEAQKIEIEGSET